MLINEDPNDTLIDVVEIDDDGVWVILCFTRNTVQEWRCEVDRWIQLTQWSSREVCG